MECKVCNAAIETDEHEETAIIIMKDDQPIFYHFFCFYEEKYSIQRKMQLKDTEIFKDYK